MNQYDVIVVGAGNGGLAAAAKTAKEGYKTLLLEKHNLPGGCATSFRRGRFEFEPSLHELCHYCTAEELASTENIFEELGIDVPLAKENVLFRTISRGEDGYDVTLRTGDEAFLDDLEAAVPGSRESAAAYLKLNDELDDAMRYTEKNPIPNPAVLVSKYATFLRVASHSTDEVMDAMGIPKKAQSILGTYWGYLGVPTDELNGLHYLQLLTAYMRGRPSMPYHRSHELSLALVKNIQDHGGEIRYNSEVTKFLYDENNVTIGVCCGEQRFYAKQIISNIIPHNVFNRSDNRKINQRMRKLANARRFGMSVVTVYLGLDCTMEELGVKDYSVFVQSDNNSRVQFNDCKDGFGMYIVNCLNRVIPDCTPEGTCTLFFTIPVFPGQFPEKMAPQEYKAYKNDLARKYIEDYEKLMGISIMPHIEEISIATPVTFARYLGTPEGTIYGYENSGVDNVVMRTAMKDLDYNMPHIHYCGGHYVRGDGFPSGYITGMMAANAAINELRRDK